VTFQYDATHVMCHLAFNSFLLYLVSNSDVSSLYFKNIKQKKWNSKINIQEFK